MPITSPATAVSSTARPMLQPGQRLPNFALPNAQGMVERFYDRFAGNLVALFLAPSLAEAETGNELQALVQQREAFNQAATAVVAVSRESVASLADLASAQGLELPLYADVDGAVTQGLGALGPDGEGLRVSYLLDRNQRVLACFTGRDHAQRLLACLHDCAAPPPAGRTVAAQAPVLLVPNVFDGELCERALTAWRGSHSEGAVSIPERAYAETAARKPTGALYSSLKKRLDHVAGDDLNPLLMKTAMSRLKPELRKAFQFRVGGLERFCIGAYEAARSDFFRPHRDNITEMTKDRRFAVSIALNDDFDGGGVRFAEFSQDVYNPPLGGALVFSCSLLHEALPVTRGVRFAAFTFFFEAGHLPAEKSPLKPALTASPGPPLGSSLGPEGPGKPS